MGFFRFLDSSILRLLDSPELNDSRKNVIQKDNRYSGQQHLPGTAKPLFNLLHVFAIRINHTYNKDNEKNNGKYDAALSKHGVKLILKVLNERTKLLKKHLKLGFNFFMVSF